MIVSFTPNPAVDKTLLVDGLDIGRVNRAAESHLDPGGKGINVSRVVHRLGGETVALGVLGGHVGRIAEHALRREGVPFDVLWIDEETRLNVVLMDRTTRAGTRVWDLGPALDEESVGDVEALVGRHLAAADVLVSGGSLLRGMPDDLHRRVLQAARDHGTKTILDADGKWLRDALPARPDLIKPNAREAAALLGRPIEGLEQVVAAAAELVRRGLPAVVISSGADGCVLATPHRTVRAVPPRVELQSTVGSGDSLVAGLALAMARGEPLEEGLRVGTAAGAATAMTVGTRLASAEEIRDLIDDVSLEVL